MDGFTCCRSGILGFFRWRHRLYKLKIKDGVKCAGPRNKSSPKLGFYSWAAMSILDSLSCEFGSTQIYVSDAHSMVKVNGNDYHLFFLLLNSELLRTWPSLSRVFSRRTMTFAAGGTTHFDILILN